MSKDVTPLNKRACITGEPVCINHFVVPEDAAARDDACVKALEEALAERETSLSEEPITRW